MKMPRDIGGDELARRLAKYDYHITRQTGSHIRLTTHQHGEHHITIPRHKSLTVGTLNGILTDIANHFSTTKEVLIRELFL